MYMVVAVTSSIVNLRCILRRGFQARQLPLGAQSCFLFFVVVVVVFFFMNGYTSHVNLYTRFINN